MEARSQKKINVNILKTILALVFVLLIAPALPARAEDADYGNDCNSAEPIEPNGTSIEGVLSDAGDEDWFSFTAVDQGLYEVTFWSQTGSKHLAIYGPDGCPGSLQQIAGLITTSAGVTTEVFIETAGTYYLRAYMGYADTSGLYRLSVDLLSTHPVEYRPLHAHRRWTMPVRLH